VVKSSTSPGKACGATGIGASCQARGGDLVIGTFVVHVPQVGG